LLRQFAGWSKDKSLLALPVTLELFKERQRICQRFSGTRPGLPNNILSRM
jgi:hypothetical protein